MKLSTLLLAGAAVAFTAATADAASVRPYVGAKVGATMEYGKAKTASAKDFDETKIFGSAAFGLDFAMASGNIRTEIEYTYRNQFEGDINSTDKAKAKTQSGFLNVYYDLPVKWVVRPYVGVGGGWSRIEGEVTNVAAKKTKNAFGWNAGAGIGWSLTKNFALDLGYRYVDPGEWKSGGQKIELHNHEFYLGARYTF